MLEHGYINDNPNTKIPRAVAKFPNLGVDFWNVTSVPLEHIGNIRTTVKMADVVGGGLVVNGMVRIQTKTLAPALRVNILTLLVVRKARGTGPYTIAWSNTAAFLPLRNFTTADSYAAVLNIVAADSKGQQEEEDALPAVYRNSPELLAGYRAQRAILRRHLGSLDAAAIEFPFTAAGFGTSGLNKPLSRGSVTLAPSSGTGNTSSSQ